MPLAAAESEDEVGAVKQALAPKYFITDSFETSLLF